MCFRLKPLDIEFMKRLHEKVNIIPLIAKADTLTPEECQQFKKQVGKMSWFLSFCVRLLSVFSVMLQSISQFYHVIVYHVKNNSWK